jgi:hypothetical protein
MSDLAELIPETKSLSRADKLRLIQVLAEDLAGDEAGGGSGEANDVPVANRSFEVWSPESAFLAADVMLHALAREAKG